VPPAPFAVDGDWHRILSSAFLHFGPLHVSLNLLGLLYFGRRLERSWGGLTLLGTYLLAALGSMALTPWLMDRAALSGPTILIGASGGVMGLVGALLAQTIVDLIRERSGPSVQEFVVLCTVVVLQSTFDANTPEVSSEAHLLGLGIGAGCGFLVNLGRRIALLWRKRL
jgi:membrane associated rhomboid family serine protease